MSVGDEIRSRRALLLSAVAGAAAWSTTLLARPTGAAATQGSPVIAGQANSATATTGIDTSTGIGLSATSSQVSGVGVQGSATSVEAVGYGVYGTTEGPSGAAIAGVSHASSGAAPGVYGGASSVTAAGVQGVGPRYGVRGDGFNSDAIGSTGVASFDGTGVMGFSANGGALLPAAKAKTGVYGQATQDATARGVWGNSTTGRGVYGNATSGSGVYGLASSGSGLYGTATTGYAIRGSGRLRFDKVSGVVTVPAGNSSWPVTPGTGIDVNAASFVLLTPRVSVGTRSLWYTLDTAGNTITIKLSSAVAVDTPIGWLLVG